MRRLIAPSLLVPVFLKIGFTGIAERHLGLAAIDTSPRAVPVVIAIPSNMLGAVRHTTALAASVKGIRALVPPAEILFVVAYLGILAPLYLSLLGSFRGHFDPVSVRA